MWEASPEPGREFTDRAVVRDSVKKMILGFLAGAVFAAVFIAFRYIMSDKLQDAGELKNRFGLRVVAQVPGLHKKRIWVGFDRLFARMGGLVLCERDAATLVGALCFCVGENESGRGKSHYAYFYWEH